MNPIEQVRTMLQSAIEKKQKSLDAADFKQLTESLVKEISSSISPDEVSTAVIDRITKAVEPALAQLLQKENTTKEDIMKAIHAIEIHIPEAKMPEIPAPIVNVPAPVVHVPAPIVNIPETKFPEYPDFPSSFRIDGVSPKTPLHVQMVDPAGKPMMFPASIGGGRGDFFTIKDIQNSTGGSLIDNDGNLKIAGSFSVTASNSSTQVIDSSGNAVNAANPFPVTIVSGGSTTTASALVDSSGVQYSGSNPLPTTASLSLAVGQGDSATATRTVQAGDSISSVYAQNPVDNGDSATALRVVVAGNSAASVSASQVGTWNITTLTTITNTLAANVVDSSGVAYTTSNPLPIGDAGGSLTVDGTVTVSSITASTSSALTDSSGIQYSGSNPLPITLISGALTSTLVVGDSAARAADNAGNPVKVGGIARTTNPTVFADGDRAHFSTDKLARQLIRPIQVRDLIATAYTTLSTGTETTILTAAAGTFLDCIWMGFVNTSSAAVQVDIRALSGGNIVSSVYIPANSTAGWAPPVPWPQDATGNAWTADMGDITNSNVLINALFSKEL